ILEIVHSQPLSIGFPILWFWLLNRSFPDAHVQLLLGPRTSSEHLFPVLLHSQWRGFHPTQFVVHVAYCLGSKRVLRVFRDQGNIFSSILLSPSRGFHAAFRFVTWSGLRWLDTGIRRYFGKKGCHLAHSTPAPYRKYAIKLTGYAQMLRKKSCGSVYPLRLGRLSRRFRLGRH